MTAAGAITRSSRTPAPFVRLEPLASLDSAREEWSDLARRTQNIFATWEWSAIWWRHFGRDRPLLATACRSRDGALIAILPLYLATCRPLRVLRFLGHGPGDELGPIHAPEDWRLAGHALRDLLSKCPLTWDVLLGEQVRGNEEWGTLLGARVLRREGCPVLHAPGGWEAYLATRSANFRQQVRRKERRLARDYTLRYRLADDPMRLGSDLDALFALHRSRWSASDSSFAMADQEFHRDFAQIASERGWLRLWFLELDGVPRAAWYGFRFEGVESYYQAGRDMSSTDLSLGFVLLAHSIRAALEDGVREYRLLRGGEAFKYRFADADPALQTLGVARGLRGALALGTIAAVGTHLPVSARRWVLR